MAKRKGGLHKKISSIFDGVPVPHNTDSAQGPLQHGPEDHSSQVDPESVSPPAPTSITASQYDVAPKGPDPAKRLDKRSVGYLRRQKKQMLSPPPGISDKRRKTMLVLLPILVLIFVILVVRIVSPPKKKSPATVIETIAPLRSAADSGTAVAGSIIRETPADITDVEIAWHRPEVFTPVKRDPMFVEPKRKIEAKKKQVYKPLEYVVQKILISESGRSAVIEVKGRESLESGSHWVHEGESVLGAQVIKISKDSVELEKNNKQWTVLIQRFQEKEQVQ